MKIINRKAFSLMEVLCAVAIFAGASLAITKCFMENATMPKVDQTAVALIADIDNCMTHRVELESEKEVHCLFAPGEHFKAKCVVKKINDHLNLWTLTIQKHPHLPKPEETLAYLYEYVN
ncbi:MAG: prepilin-type N-terminal cleavage/methylation domain-containing protein [Puniceicoccales bacterium]|jgi:prepilin-type N-terminal cleavage/methylation domain-containing protein|nr:prepilin-type N-terminal cleavage/methylation domain-containing protein [Puniceicoccales bacterium]